MLTFEIRNYVGMSTLRYSKILHWAKEVITLLEQSLGDTGVKILSATVREDGSAPRLVIGADIHIYGDNPEQLQEILRIKDEVKLPSAKIFLEMKANPIKSTET